MKKTKIWRERWEKPNESELAADSVVESPTDSEKPHNSVLSDYDYLDISDSEEPILISSVLWETVEESAEENFHKSSELNTESRNILRALALKQLDEPNSSDDDSSVIGSQPDFDKAQEAIGAIPKQNEPVNSIQTSENSEEQEEEFFVERILSRRYDYNKKQYYYLIKWEGYSSEENTWEPAKNLQTCQKLVEAFEEALAKQQAAKQTPTLSTPACSISTGYGPNKSGSMSLQCSSNNTQVNGENLAAEPELESKDEDNPATVSPQESPVIGRVSSITLSEQQLTESKNILKALGKLDEQDSSDNDSFVIELKQDSDQFGRQLKHLLQGHPFYTLNEFFELTNMNPDPLFSFNF